MRVGYCAASATRPVLHRWTRNADSSITGFVLGKPGFQDGEQLTTSAILSEHIVDDVRLAKTVGGSVYRLLGDERETVERHSRRRLASSGRKASPLDMLQRGQLSPSVRYEVGGADAGGPQGDRILRTFEIEDSLLYLTGVHAAARRVLLFVDEQLVAVAVAEIHAAQGVIDVPVLATAKARRRQGFGSVLTALLQKLGCQLQLRVLLVASTPAAVSFWEQKGLRTPQGCPPAVRTVLRRVGQLGLGTGFANSIPMAMGLPDDDAVIDDALAAMRRRNRRTSGYTAEEIASMAGYREIAGSVWLRPDGLTEPVVYTEHEQLPAELEWMPYSSLRVFWTGKRGWGLRCEKAILAGQV